MKNLNSEKLIRYSSLVVLVFAIIYLIGLQCFPGELIIASNFL